MRPRSMTYPLAMAAALMLTTGCGGSTEGAAGTAGGSPGAITVVASTDVYGDIARRIGGDRVAVTSIIDDPQQDPHSYEADTRTRLALSKAKVIIENGGGYDDFVDTMLKATANPSVKVLNVVAISGRTAPAGGELNEHLWYDLPTTAKLADRIATALSAVDPAQADDFTSNAKAFEVEIDSLRKRVEDLAATENGFSFRYDTVRVGDALQARFITGPDVGRKTPLVFEEGKNITTLSAQGDGTAVVTHVDGVGAGEGDAGLRTTQANAGLIGVYPLLDDVESHTDVSILSTLAGYARRRLARGKAPVVLPKIAVNPAADPVLGSYTVGDVVRVRSGYGLVTVDDPYLIVQIDGTLDRSGGEKVEITYAVADAFTTI